MLRKPHPMTLVFRNHVKGKARRGLIRWCSSLAASFKPDVKAALDNNLPVVALESTIITHGMPYPKNVTTALKVQDIIREKGAVPATIGVLNGRIKIGLTDHELEYLANSASNAVKVSRRDLPMVTSKGMNGGTTVASTMLLAHKAGIPIFVTGGIGGVHRGGETSWDVSADLTELGRTPVAVVCSGVKSILDIGRTLQVLETQGVGVATFGDSADFPAFYCRRSGFASPCQLSTIDEAVAYVRAHLQLQLHSGLLIAVPVPEPYAMNDELIENAIKQAVTEAESQGIVGPKVTPFILKHIAQATAKGQSSLTANIALIENNADVGARIAVGLIESKTTRRRVDSTGGKGNGQVTVIGGSVVDLVVHVTSEELVVSLRGDGYT